MTEELKDAIRNAFTDAEFPGEWRLQGSFEGSEPFMVTEEFKDKKDWQALDPEFLDNAPKGLRTALCFFSDEAFRFYLPAYLIADIDGKLKEVDVVFHLTNGLTDDSKDEKVNPRRYGERSFHDCAIFRFSVFSREQCKVIEDYLKFKLESGDSLDGDWIKQALENYWSKKAAA